MTHARGLRRTHSAAAGLAIIALALVACTGSPDPSPEQPDFGTLPPPAQPLPLEDLEDFSAVVMLNAGSNCSGTVIDTGIAAAPAYVLTNGHCVGDVSRPAQQTTTDLEWAGEAEFFRAQGNLESTYTAQVLEIAYSTMRQTDTAIVRLDATLGELEALGVQPVPIADVEPKPGDAVVNVGVPVQELMDSQWVLRRGECTLDRQHTLLELNWIWYDVWANDCPGIIQGSSGSAVFEVDATGAPRQIVGLINTTSWGTSQAAGGACWISRPCQVTPSGAVMVEETSYAQSVAGLMRCFDEEGLFRFGDPCPLPDSDIWAERGGGSYRGGALPDAAGVLPTVDLAGREAGSARTALIPLGMAEGCLDPATYSGVTPMDLPEGGEFWEMLGVTIDVDLPETEGRYLLCAVRADAYEAAASVPFQVRRSPPPFPADAEVMRVEDGVFVQPHMNPPEIGMSRFTWGAPGRVDCSDPDSFQTALMVPLFIPDADLPAEYCLVSFDDAGNATPVTRIDIPAR